MEFVGIDVSKETLQLSVLGGLEAEFQNDRTGRSRLARKLQSLKAPTRVVLEPTATYHLEIAKALHELDNVEVMVANPRTTAAFVKATDQRGKSDRKDANSLARFASVMEFRAWSPPSDACQTLRSYIRRRDQLVRQRTKEKVRLKEALATGQSDAFLIEDIQECITELGNRIQRWEARALVAVKEQKELHQWHEQLKTVPGIGDVIALVILAELSHLDPTMDARQLTAYAGVDPRPWQSGKMDARRSISKRGNKRLRTVMYLAAWNAARFSPHVGAWRETLLQRGKAPNVTYVAVARRLLHAIWGMRRANTPWTGDRFFQVDSP